MGFFRNHSPEEVRERLLENGSACGHRNNKGDPDCQVIIQPAEDGKLGTGINLHWGTVHKEKP